MAAMELPYHVGLLSAAGHHGASHQQPQEFQVVTDRSILEDDLITDGIGEDAHVLWMVSSAESSLVLPPRRSRSSRAASAWVRLAHASGRRAWMAGRGRGAYWENAGSRKAP